MIAFAALSLLLVSNPAEPGQFENAGYEALAVAETDAISTLEALHSAGPDDPAIMLNLAAAYIEEGRLADARDMYVRAIESRERMELELADGSWADSRYLARQGLDRLERSRAWASR